MDWGDWGCLTPIILQPVSINQTNLAHLTVYRPCKHQSTFKKRFEWQIRQTSSCHIFHNMVPLKPLQQFLYFLLLTDGLLLMCIQPEAEVSSWNGDFMEKFWEIVRLWRWQHSIFELSSSTREVRNFHVYHQKVAFEWQLLDGKLLQGLAELQSTKLPQFF